MRTLSAVAGLSVSFVLVACGAQPPTVTARQGTASGDLVAPDGQGVFPEFALSPSAGGSQSKPAAASNGDGYLVAWQDTRNGSPDIYAARVTRAGVVLDPSGIPVATGTAKQQNPAVAFDGAAYLVVWEDGTAGRIYATRISPEGQVLSSPVAISPAGQGAQAPAVACAGAIALVAWDDGHDVRAVRVVAGQAAGSTVVVTPVAGDQVAAAVASDGASWLVAWQEFRTGYNNDIYGVRVSAAGAVVDATPIGLATGIRDQVNPALGFDGTDYLLVNTSAGDGTPWDTRAKRITTAGVVVDATALTLANATAIPQGFAAVTFDGTNVVAAWGDQRNAVRDVWAAEVTPAAEILGIFPVASGNGSKNRPTLASDGADRVLFGFERVDPATNVSRLHARVAAMRATVSVSKTGLGQGTVASSPAGISCGDACEATFQGGQSVTLTATPASGFLFAGWTGACESAGTGPCTLVLDDDKAAVARFEYPPWPLSVATLGQGTGIVTGGGIQCASGSAAGCAAEIPYTAPWTVVTLVAAATNGSRLVGWQGCTSASGDVCTVTMDAARAVTATFDPPWPLAVRTNGYGTGTVTGPGVQCTTAFTTGCDALVPNTLPAQVVTLTASPAADSFFGEWIGCTSFDGTTCTVTMSAAKTVTATFQPKNWVLTVKTSGTGSGAVTGAETGIDCASNAGACSGLVPNTAVPTSTTLVATPDAVSIFAGWIGCTEVTGNTCSVSVSRPTSVTATFQPKWYTLTAKTYGSGTGTVANASYGIGCTGNVGTCTAQVLNLTPPVDVVLTATPNDVSIFAGWTGCTSVSGSDCTVSMSRATSVTATFQPKWYTLTAKTSGSGTGTVANAPYGIGCTGNAGTCTAQVLNLTPPVDVVLTATPNDVSIFAGWTGCTSVSGSDCTVSMSRATSVTATFQPKWYTLTAKTSGTGTGTVGNAEYGVACTGNAGTCTAQVLNLTPPVDVVLTATPNDVSIFTGWYGCTSVSGSDCTVSMSRATSVTATFQPKWYTLTARTSGTGGGTVTGADTGISCTSNTGTCTAQVLNLTPPLDVVLTAAPNDASIFTGWSGCTTTSGTSCTVSMTGARSVTATFQPKYFTLTAKTSGTGGGTVTGADTGISCTFNSGTCTAQVLNTTPATDVVLTAAANDASIFTGWSGCTTVSGASCTVSMTGAKTATATFQPKYFTLTARTTGTGSGTVTGDGGISCSANAGTCTAQVLNTTPATNAVLTATPDDSSLFAGWTGCTSVSGNVCTVGMTGPRTVTATFQPKTWTLSVRTYGTGGTVTGSDGFSCTGGPCTLAVANTSPPTDVTLTAVPNAGSSLSSWSGCTSVSGTACTVSMTGAKSVFATFATP